MQNLRDKLLKAGLVTEQEARPAPKASAPSTADARPASSALPKLPPLPGSREHQRQEAAKQQQLAERLLRLVLAGQVALQAGDRAFYFATRKGKLRRLDLSPAQAEQLERGELAVVERQAPAQIEHALVPAAVAEEMHRLLEKSVRFLSRPGAPVGFQPSIDEDAPAEDEPAVSAPAPVPD